MFRALIDQSNDAIEVIDARTRRVVDVNERACRDLGYSREELLSLSVADIDASDDPVRHLGIQQSLEQDRFVVTESLHRRKDHSIFPVELSLRMVDLDKPYVVSVARDITERKQDEQKLRELQQLLREQAIHDPLTGLYNRRYLEEVLARELIVADRKSHCVSVIMGDLDHFKRVNDAYGHRWPGPQVSLDCASIRQVAEVMLPRQRRRLPLRRRRVSVAGAGHGGAVRLRTRRGTARKTGIDAHPFRRRRHYRHRVIRGGLLSPACPDGRLPDFRGGQGPVPGEGGGAQSCRGLRRRWCC